jgi:frataxin-like iron-binding protein CyaY
MKYILLSCVCFVLFTNTVSAQKKIHDPNAELRMAKNFHAIHISGGIDLYLSEGEEAVAVSASESKFREKIKVTVADGVLKIWYDDNSSIVMSAQKNLKAYVSFRDLDLLKASSGCDIKVEGRITGKIFKMHISSGSDFDGKIEVDELEVEQHSGADIVISGSSRMLTINATSGSDFNGNDFKADICRVDAKSGSDVSVTVSVELSVKASGSSDVHYRGGAVIKNVSANSGSSVKRRH